MTDTILIAVNGTLMRGQPTNSLLTSHGAVFVKDARTAPVYRLWNIGNKHPAMARDEQAGASIALELWEITPENMISVLREEPPGLVMGKVSLDDGSTVFGILAEPYLLAGAEEITHFFGWRGFLSARNA